MHRFVKTIVLLAVSLFCFPHFSHAKPAGSPHNKKLNIAGVDVTGLDASATQRRVKRELGKKLNTKVSLTDGARRLRTSRRSLGYQLDLGWMLARSRAGHAYVPLRFAVNRKVLTQALRRVAPRFAAPARSARLSWNGRVQIIPERAGRRLNIGASVPRIAQQVERNAAANPLKLSVRLNQPQRRRTAFKGITGRLAQFTTRFNPGNVKRTTNMRLAIKSINGTIVKPGATFSLNDTVGERSQKRGYRTAVIFKNGYKAPGIGAGVSQVTGTLFNTVLLAGLPITQYRTHSRPVAYLPLGRDATVAWGAFDFKWKNNTGAPIYISYKLSGNHAMATLYGKRVPQQNVRLRVVSKKLGPRRITSKLYRTIRRQGRVVRKEEVGTSQYDWKEGDWE